MKINPKKKEGIFADIRVGEVFSDDALIVMKIGQFYDAEENPINAIDLSDGSVLYYESFDIVMPLDAELNY